MDFSSLLLTLFPCHLLFLILLFLPQGIPHIQVLSLVPVSPLTFSSPLLLSRRTKKVGVSGIFLLSDSILLFFSSVFVEEKKSLPLFTVQDPFSLF